MKKTAEEFAKEQKILPDVIVKIKNVKEDIYVVSVEDNGPGIVKEQIPRVFGKLLYGSKFHRLRQSRGQQGIGISSVTLYSQLTTGQPTRVWSKVESQKKTYYMELHLNTVKNEPDILKQEDIDKDVLGEHGVRVEMILHGRYRKLVEDYIKQTSISNPFAKISYTAPDGTKKTYPRSLNDLPKQPKTMKPHPYGVEFGTLQRMLQNTSSRTLMSFLTNEFSSIGQQSAKEVCKVAKVDGNIKPGEMDRATIEKIIKAMQVVKIQRPPLDCLSPIGYEELEKSLKKEYPNAEFVTAINREPDVYRGFPFLIEIGIVYGFQDENGKKKNDEEDDERDTGSIELIRFANRVPLLYQQSACALTEAVKEVDWKRYDLDQKGNNLPSGPMKLVVHICSVWVPFVSESKEAVASYPEIIKETKLALQDAGRKLSSYLSGKRRAGDAKRRIQIFERYTHEVARSLSILTNKNERDIEKKIKDMVTSRIHIKEGPEENTDADDKIKIIDKNTKKEANKQEKKK
ncbi:MAG: DNA topoisomerase VI subunit B [Candidatus Aenigmarchaeota archaeon]|nr:DNA topoisomerase VI subunit B [Candidatus Aenigmarchaeota archaeon]